MRVAMHADNNKKRQQINRAESYPEADLAITPPAKTMWHDLV